jgi:hypothetical protein
VGIGFHTFLWRYSKDSSGSQGSDCGWVDCVRWTPAHQNYEASLSDALDTTLGVMYGGNGGFGRTTADSYNGGDSAVSGATGYYQSSTMEVDVNGPGSGSFYWKVSSEESCDYLEFYIDGVRQDRISGEVDWSEKTFTVTGSGPHVLIWQYIKDGSGDEGDDCGYVDWLQWTASGPPDWTEVEYTYDPSGRRIAKTFDSVVTNKYGAACPELVEGTVTASSPRKPALSLPNGTATTCSSASSSRGPGSISRSR